MYATKKKTKEGTGDNGEEHKLKKDSSFRSKAITRKKKIDYY